MQILFFTRKFPSMLVFPGVILLMSACAGPSEATAIRATGTIPAAETAFKPSPTPAAITATSPTPTARPSNTPEPKITIYNRYVGKDSARQPEPIREPLTEIITIREVEGYEGSFVDAALDGKMVGGAEI